MSSIFHPESTSRNLVRISGLGYRENIELGEAGERARAKTRLHAAISMDMQAVDIASYLSERRNIALPPS
ncbi:hypothetical protein [Neorhizobium alkalisoli]|uniref:hypothetical protein n=1 Tax=Neorhizobium alkalisoli TaxID=528178 RepID=UPI000CFA4631|nr:hypothetical protein [Neorhizobium alkalisoli]